MRNQIISPKRLFLRVTHYSIDGIDERQIQRRVTYFADKIFYRCRQRDRPSWKQSTTVFLVEVTGLEPAISTTRKDTKLNCKVFCVFWCFLFRRISLFCTIKPYFPRILRLLMANDVVSTRFFELTKTFVISGKDAIVILRFKASFMPKCK